MKEHAQDVAQAIMRGNYTQLGTLVGRTWQQNQLLDNGTNPPEVQAIIEKVQDLCLGLKLPGAGGGGYLYMIAKSPEAAARIRSILTQNPPNACARFVDMSLSDKGFQVSRS
jgi:galactokinase/mevalonate kinase-like predicted kinase